MTRRNHDKTVEAAAGFLAAFADALQADGYLAAVWKVQDGRLRLTSLTADNFPLGDRVIAEQQLREVNDEERQFQATPPPMPSIPSLPTADRFSIVPQGDNNEHESEILNEPVEQIEPDSFLKSLQDGPIRDEEPF